MTIKEILEEVQYQLYDQMTTRNFCECGGARRGGGKCIKCLTNIAQECYGNAVVASILSLKEIAEATHILIGAEQRFYFARENLINAEKKMQLLYKKN